MSKTLFSIAQALRALVSLVVLGLLSTAGFLAYQEFDKRHQLDRELQATNAKLAEQMAEVARLAKENEKLSLAVRLLKVDHRVAQIEVLDQNAGGQHGQTMFRFVELTSDGNPVDTPREFTIEGDLLYVDALVIKYADELVESGDPLRSTSVCLFQRLFGEHQKPSEGFALDASGSRPSVYSQGSEITPAEKDIWANFWDYANNPQKLEAAGLRAAHGEAPSIRLKPGKRYKLDLRASGGLSIVTDDSPQRPRLR